MPRVCLSVSKGAAKVCLIKNTAHRRRHPSGEPRLFCPRFLLARLGSQPRLQRQLPGAANQPRLQTGYRKPQPSYSLTYRANGEKGNHHEHSKCGIVPVMLQPVFRHIDYSGGCQCANSVLPPCESEQDYPGLVIVSKKSSREKSDRWYSLCVPSSRAFSSSDI